MSRVDLQLYESKLLDLIYSAAMGFSTWSEFLQALNDRMHHAKTTFLVLDNDAERSSLALSAAFTGREIQDYNNHFGAINPWTPGVAERRVGLGVTADQMLPTAELKTTEFYNDFLRSAGMEGGVGLTIERNGGRSVLLSSLCSGADLPKTSEHAALFTRLSPHLKRALDLYDRRLAATPISDAHILDCVDSGIIVFNDDGKVAYTNNAAQLYFSMGVGVKTNVMGQITFEDDAAREAFSRLRQGNQGSLSWRKRTDFGVFDLSLMSRRSEFYVNDLFVQRFVLLITLVTGDIKRPLQGLTAREVEVAKCLLNGMTNEQIAAKHRVSKETVRTQTKSIYHKLAVSGRLELIRLYSSE